MKSPEINYQMARCFEDRKQAMGLLQSAYAQAGLAESNGDGFRVTKYHLLPDSRIFVTKIDRVVTSTLSFFPDSSAGLPLEAIYPHEVASLRTTGIRLAEVGCFADRREHPSRFMESFSQLARLIFQYSLAQGIDGFLIAVHPRHAKFYKKYLCFEEIGGVVHYPLVRNRPAKALFLQFSLASKQAPERFKVLLGETIPQSSFSNGQMPQNECDFFARYLPSEKSTFFPAISLGSFPQIVGVQNV